jgi:hypothetical protein
MSNLRPVGSAIENVPHMMAFLDALAKTLTSIDISSVLVQLPDYAPSVALPYLAEQYDMLGYKGYSLCTTDDQRRALLRNAVNINRKLGTPYSIEQAIISIGYPNAIVTEGTGIYYNGIYNFDGSKRYGGGKWYNIDVEVFYTGAAPTTSQITLITGMINKYKSTRSVLFNLKFTEQV